MARFSSSVPYVAAFMNRMVLSSRLGMRLAKLECRYVPLARAGWANWQRIAYCPLRR